MTHRVFLDANVLFSCAYQSQSRLNELWHLPDVVLVSSSYAIEEAQRNLAVPAHEARLAGLLNNLEIVRSWEQAVLPANLRLAPKDVPILKAAIAASATHLLTGDRKDFGHLFGKTVRGVKIHLPAQYFDLKRRGEIR